jgi:hypothetical protein
MGLTRFSSNDPKMPGARYRSPGIAVFVGTGRFVDCDIGLRLCCQSHSSILTPFFAIYLTRNIVFSLFFQANFRFSLQNRKSLYIETEFDAVASASMFPQGNYCERRLLAGNMYQVRSW